MYILHVHYLEKWAWAKMYKTLNCTVYQLFELQCTQLTDTSIVSNLKRHFKVNCSHLLALSEGDGKNTEIVYIHDIAKLNNTVHMFI